MIKVYFDIAMAIKTVPLSIYNVINFKLHHATKELTFQGRLES